MGLHKEQQQSAFSVLDQDPGIHELKTIINIVKGKHIFSFGS
jgi:hypothetical protein